MVRVLVPLAQGCEELEAVSIIDLLRAGVEVVTAGLADGPVTCSRGVVIVPDVTLDDVLDGDFDMIVLPGGLPGAQGAGKRGLVAGQAGDLLSGCCRCHGTSGYTLSGSVCRDRWQGHHFTRARNCHGFCPGIDRKTGGCSAATDRGGVTSAPGLTLTTGVAR